MAAYTHLVRVLSHKEYLGDFRLPGAVRSRVFGDENGKVAAFTCRSAGRSGKRAGAARRS